jgi:hypothetical protein
MLTTVVDLVDLVEALVVDHLAAADQMGQVDLDLASAVGVASFRAR